MRDRPVYIGIDPTAGRRPTHFAVLDSQLHVINEGALAVDQLVQEVDKYPLAVCAVDAPMGPNLGLLAVPEIRRRFGLPPNGATWSQYKVSEFELRRRGIKLYNTPIARERAPAWMQAGWRLYAHLRNLGFEAYHPDSSAGRQVCEVHPHASFTVLLERLPFQKGTLEGRLQRQLLLFEERVEVPDAMEVFEEITRYHLLRGELDLKRLQSHDALDAMVAALTAFYAGAHPDHVTLVGDRVEGYIVVPTASLKHKYN